jgi:hypothetical protein
MVQEAKALEALKLQGADPQRAGEAAVGGATARGSSSRAETSMSLATPRSSGHAEAQVRFCRCWFVFPELGHRGVRRAEG